MVSQYPEEIIIYNLSFTKDMDQQINSGITNTTSNKLGMSWTPAAVSCKGFNTGSRLLEVDYFLLIAAVH